MTVTRAFVLAAAAGIAALLPACDGGAPATRGFGSVQLLQSRDQGLLFKGAVGDFVLYSTGGNPPSYWSVNLTTGDVAPSDSIFSNVPAPANSTCTMSPFKSQNDRRTTWPASAVTPAASPWSRIWS